MASKRKLVIERIEAIQNLLSKNPSGLKSTEISNVLNHDPMGTIQSTLSTMKRTGNLLYENELYILPLFPKSAAEIANNLQNYRREYNREYKSKAKRTPTIFDQDKPVDANAIQDAITLLKRNGFRVYKSITELKEV